MTYGACASIIQNKRLLTNAHAVANAIEIMAIRPSDQLATEARPMYIDHDRELALLEVADTSFFDGSDQLALGQGPAVGAHLVICALSATPVCTVEISGHVERIETTIYRHSVRELPVLVATAQVPEGSSGAPALVLGRIVGIAFQTRTAGTVDLIPASVINTFLDDLTDNTITGVPDLGVYWQKLSNRFLREYLSIEHGGVLVTDVIDGSSAYGTLIAGDSIMAIDGLLLDEKGIASTENGPLHFTQLVGRKQIGDHIHVRFMRNSVLMDREIVLRSYVSLIPVNHPPAFLIVGGIVMMTLTHELMRQKRESEEFFRYKYYALDLLPSYSRRQIVIIIRVIPDDVNIGYQNIWGVRVTRVNNVAISCISDISSAILNPLNGYQVIEIDNTGARTGLDEFPSDYGNLIVFSAHEAEAADTRIRTQIGTESVD